MRNSYIVLNGKRDNYINTHTTLYFDIFFIKTPIQLNLFEKYHASNVCSFQTVA